MNQNQSAIVRSVADKRLMAQKVNGLLKNAEDHGRRTLEHFKQVGEELIRAKQSLGHGEFLGWVDAHVHCSHSRAQRMMRVARDWSKCCGAASFEEALQYLTRDEKIEKTGTSVKIVPESVVFARKVEGIRLWLEEVKTTKGQAAWMPDAQKKLEPVLALCKELPNMPQDFVFSLPAALNNEQFRRTWEEWIEYRKEKKSRIVPTTAKKQLAELASWGLVKAIEALEASMKNGWLGVFEPGARRSGPDLHAGLRAFVERGGT